jgi:hypothetical protein
VCEFERVIPQLITGKYIEEDGRLLRHALLSRRAGVPAVARSCHFPSAVLSFSVKVNDLDPYQLEVVRLPRNAETHLIGIQILGTSTGLAQCLLLLQATLAIAET